MFKPDLSTKRLAINKANAQMVTAVAVAAFVSVFCLMASRAVWMQIHYQSRVTAQKQQAHQQLQKNLAAFDELVQSYQSFDNASTNIIGGNKLANGDNDGSNSKIILDALPSSYDFPALTSTLEKIVSDRGMSASNIAGTDDEVAQQGNAWNPTPKPVEMPFSLSVKSANYDSVQKLIDALQKSIRPMQIDTLDLDGGASSMSVDIKAHTYYQPGKSVNIEKKVVK